MMKNARNHRIVALMLVICMLVSLIPSGFAADAEETNYTYNLARLQWGRWSNEGNNPSTLTEWDTIYTLGNYHNRTTDPFMYYSQSAGMTWAWTPSSNLGVGPTFQSAVGEWGGFNIRVGETAMYDFSVKSLSYEGTPVARIYLAPCGVENPRDPSYLMGDTTKEGDVIGSQKTETLGRRFLPAGDYTVVFENITGQTAYMGAIAEVGLSWVSSAPSERLMLSGTVDDSVKGESRPLTVSATWDGEEIALEDLDILRVDVKDSEIATLEKTEDGYVVHAIWKGETAVRVSAEHQGEITAIDIPFAVVLPEGYLEVDLDVAGETSCKMNESATVPVTYLINREAAPASEVSVTATIDDETLAEVTVADDGSVQIFGKRGGKGKITVTVEKDGKSASKTVKLTVDPIRYFYSLHNGYQGPWSNSARPLSYFVDYDMYDKNPGGERPQYWTADTQPWKYIDSSGGLIWEITQSFRTFGYIIKGGTNDYLHMGIKVPEAGVYDFALRLTGLPAAGVLNIYVSPMGTAKEDLAADRYYVGKVSGVAGTVTTGEIRSVGNVTLDKGEYNVYCVTPAESVGSNGLYLVGFCLNTLVEHQFRLSEDENLPIMEGTSGEVPLLAIYDGAEIGFEGVTDMSVISETPKLATATVTQDGETASLQVDGLAPGNAAFTVCATYNGIKTEKHISVNIARKDEVKFITLSAEKTDLAVGEKLPTVVSATCYDGSPASLAGKNIYYETSDPKAVLVNAKGEIQGVEKGAAVIRAWVQVEDKVFSCELLVTVDGYSEIAEIDIVMPKAIKRSSRVTLSTDITLKSGKKIDSSLYTVQFSVDAAEPANCVSLNNATLLGRSLGVATVKAVVTFGGKTHEVTEDIEIVRDLSGQAQILPDKLILEIAKTELCLGEFTSPKLGAYYTDGNYCAFDDDTMDLDYDEAILRFEGGKLTAVGAGETDVTLTVGEKSKTVKVTVFDETIGYALTKLEDALYAGKSAKIDVEAFTTSGKPISYECVTIAYTDAGDGIVSVDQNGVVTALAAGTTNITVTVSLGNNSVQAILPVEAMDDFVDDIILTASSTVMKPSDAEGVTVQVSTVTASGDVVPADVTNVTFESLSDILDVDASGRVTPKGVLGKGVIRATFNANGTAKQAEIEITVKSGKTKATYYTEEKFAAVRKNVATYDWAKTTANSFDSQLEYLVGQEEWVTELITSQELPRNLWAAYQYDPNYQLCRYCGTNMVADTGATYPYLIDIVNYPWKVQCPTCRRRFPSNDFGEFYKTGLDEHGFWRYELAKQNGSHLLVNKAFPEKGEGWGVDDGYGYKSGKTYETSYGVWDETWTFIAYYNAWGIWGQPGSNGTIARMFRLLTYGYTYSGGEKKKYGQLLAVMLDRVADVYPELQTLDYDPQMMDNGWYGGKFVGGIYDTYTLADMVLAYDAVYDLYEDPSVMALIRNNAAKWNFDNKNTPNEVREHIETNFLLDTKKALEDKTIYGNSGMHQKVMAYTGVVLDRMPESKELIDAALTGPEGILNTMINTVNRDGQGTENSIMYNAGWVGEYSAVADALADYDAYPAANLYQNPKFIKMLTMNLPLTMARRATLSVGDCYGLGDTALALQGSTLAKAIMAGCEEPKIAQNLYFMNGNRYNGSANHNLFLDTDAVAEKLEELIKRYGEYDFDKSTQMTGFGIGILRGGTFRADNINNINSQRAIAMWYGSTYGHGHSNTLDLSMYAYGINVMPAFGYPTNTSPIGSTTNWERATISHNTVSVNGVQQSRDWNMPCGEPIHFDDSGKVKLTDARNNKAYPEQGVSEYRRTAVMVEVDDESAYTVDLFRIIGGNEHVYSFHSQSNTVADYEGFDPIYQEMGTYAGPDVPYGPGNIASGYDSFYDVYRAVNPDEKLSITFKVDDFRDVIKENRDLYVRVTQLNDFELTDVAWASAAPPNIHGNTREIKYMLTRRNGKDLDTLFTTVIEPYDKTPLIADAEAVSVKDSMGNQVETGVRAVKVTLQNGRVDYIVYATDNTVRYRIDDKFDFIGFVGVISYRDDTVVYRYLHDGTMLDGMYGEAAITGTIESFTDTLEFDNYITIRTNQNVDPSELAGKTIYVNKTTNNLHNGAYEIQGAVKNKNGTYTLDIGDITLINSKSGNSYVTNIKSGETFRIPLTEVEDDSLTVQPIGDAVVTVGNALQVPITAESPIGRELTYKVASNTSGAAMVGNVLHFSPSKEQIGNVAILVDVSDGINTATVAIGVTVYPSTGGGGGGGGNGGTSTDEVTYTDNGDNTFTGSDGNVICAGSDKTIGTADDITNIVKGEDDKYYIKNADGTLTGAGEDGLLGTADDIKVEDATAPIDPSEKFVDLGNHTWAKEAIYRLVDAGIIKGVDDTHYAPAKQITRADFAILLVRAWNLTAEEIGTFDDVTESDYFYNEVGIASALGIVKGVGENKFDPKAPITREQMMVMLHRTLTAQGVELPTAAEDVLADFSDADEISDYAIESVKLMIGNGYIRGANGKINPQGNATRAEVAVLLDRILSK